MKNKNVSISLLSILIILSLSLSVSADENWPMSFADLERTSIYDYAGGSPFSETFSTINFTCGGLDEGTFTFNSMFNAEIDGAEGEDIVIMCFPDTQNTKVHGVIFDNSLEVTSYFDVNPLRSTQLGTSLRTITTADIDNDGMNEILVFMASSNDAEIVIYEWSGSTIEYKDSIIIQNSTETSINYTLSGLEDISDETHALLQEDLICQDNICILKGSSDMIAINMTSETGLWQNLDSDYGITYTLNVDFSVPPILSDIDNDGDTEILIISLTNDWLFIFDMMTGTLEFSSDIGGQVNAGRHFSVYDDCTSTQCSQTYKELLFNDGNTQCEFYKFDTYSVNGTLSSIRNTPHDQAGADDMVCWIEDRDSDDTIEVCSWGIDFITNAADVRCQEISLFGFDTIDKSINIDEHLTSTIIDISSAIISDFSGDGKFDIVRQGYVLDIENDNITRYNQNTSVSMIDQMPVVMTGLDNEFISFQRSGETEDEVYISTTGAIEEVELNIPITWDEGPLRSPTDPVCQNATIEISCGYLNDCVSDNELDAFQIEADCSSDGSILSGTRYYTTEQSFICQVPEINGTYNMTLSLYDNVNGININETYLLEYTVNDSAGCYEESNLTPTNNRPEWDSFPTSELPTPYCSGSGQTYNVLDTYSDTEDDDVWLKIDCDNDGVFEKQSSVNPEYFSCIYYPNMTSTSVQVCDSGSSGDCASLSWSVDVSERTFLDVIEDGNHDCNDGRLIDDNGELIVPNQGDYPYMIGPPYRYNPTDSPICQGVKIPLYCNWNDCYGANEGGDTTVLAVDCTSDGTIDYEDGFLSGDNVTLECTYTSVDRSDAIANYSGETIFEYRSEITIRPTGQDVVFSEQTLIYYQNISSDTEICTRETEEPGTGNSIQDTAEGLGDLTGMSGTLFALVVSVLSGIIVSIVALKKDKKSPLMLGLGVFSAWFLIFTFAGVIDIFILVTILLLGLIGGLLYFFLGRRG